MDKYDRLVEALSETLAAKDAYDKAAAELVVEVPATQRANYDSAIATYDAMRKEQPEIIARINVTGDRVWKLLADDFSSGVAQAEPTLGEQRARAKEYFSRERVREREVAFGDKGAGLKTSGLTELDVALLVGKMLLSVYRMPYDTTQQPGFHEFSECFKSIILG